MLVVFIVMFLILALCGLLVAFVAYAQRGEEIPVVPWLGDAMARAAEAAPTIAAEDAQPPDLRKH